MKAVRGARPEDASQAAKHRLFVEGEGDDPADPDVLKELLREKIRVFALGASYHVKSAAKALHAYHPSYYFLIDRDHHDDDYVQRLWEEFPDTDTANLLIWRRRELENYFIDPVYISESRWLNVTKDELRATVLRECQSRVFIDAANYVVVTIREILKQNWVKVFEKKSHFTSKPKALDKLRLLPDFRSRIRKTERLLERGRIESLFDRRLNQMTGGKLKIEYGRGRWLEMVRGKEILPTIVSRCFHVKNRDGRRLQGPVARREFMKDLVRLDLEKQPEDFKRLAELIRQRIESS